MNERIRELAEQAKAQYCDLGDASCFKRLGLVEAVVFTPEDLEKFAELLIFECTKVAIFKNDGMIATSDVAAGRSIAARMIREHFEVKE